MPHGRREPFMAPLPYAEGRVVVVRGLVVGHRKGSLGIARAGALVGQRAVDARRIASGDYRARPRAL